MRRSFPIALLALVLALAGCASLTVTPPAPEAQTTQATRTPPPDDSLNATVWYQTSAERDAVYREVYRAAARQLDAALADKSWDALAASDRNNDPRKLPPAIIVDVDETVLDNSPNQARLIRAGRQFDETSWRAWVEERKARPLPGALAFLQAAAARGVTVFYITNRDLSLTRATYDNLRATGFPIASTGQVLAAGYQVPGCESKGSSKSCRRQLVARGHRVLMQFGDQVEDFVQPEAGTRAGRAAALAAHDDWIGQRWWVLPNPVYGHWEPALFGNDWSRPAGERRAAKEAALDDARQ